MSALENNLIIYVIMTVQKKQIPWKMRINVFVNINGINIKMNF